MEVRREGISFFRSGRVPTTEVIVDQLVFRPLAENCYMNSLKMKKKRSGILKFVSLVGCPLLVLNTFGCKWDEQYNYEQPSEYEATEAAWQGNGDFNNGLWGWTIVNSQIRLDNDTIAGLATATDLTFLPSNSDKGKNTPDNITANSLSIVASLVQNEGYGYSAKLSSADITTKGAYDIFRGPYMYSDYTASLSAGDIISFEWQALPNGDGYDVFGYIVDITDNYTETILDDTADAPYSVQVWTTINHPVTRAGTYRIVFISGSYDLTSGKEVGADLYIDDIVISK